MTKVLARLASGAACIALAGGALPSAVSANEAAGETVTTASTAQSPVQTESLLPSESFQLENGPRTLPCASRRRQ